MYELYHDFHVLFTKDLATAAIGLAVDGDSAFHADAHATKRPARLAEN